VGLLALNGAAIAAYVTGWDRVVAALGTPGLASGPARGAGWQPPVLDADGAVRVKPYEAYVQTVARPLFGRTRRPFVAPVAEAVQAAPMAVIAPAAVAEPEVGLSAIAIRGERRQALLVTRAEPQGRWFGEGETIEGWTITGMSADTLTLGLVGRAKIVKLYDQPGTALRGAAVPVAPQPAHAPVLSLPSKH